MAWINFEKVIVYIFGLCLLAMSAYNIYFYLLKAGKYKVLANTLQYIVAVVTIILTLYYSVLIPNFRCRVDYILAIYTVSCCNLILGIIQASVLTILCFQLRSLFMYTDQIR